jgi:peptidoglycan hydrolase-like protein with peptidoglycan-binding domain
MKRPNAWMIAALGGALLLLSACGGSGTASSGGTAPPVAAAQSTFCSDLGNAIQVLDRYATVFQQDAVTVGDLQTAATALTATRDKLQSSATQLGDAITAANRASAVKDGATSTTTTVLQTQSPQDHLTVITTAEKQLQQTTTGIGASTPVRTAAVELQAAAFGLEQAYVSLFVDAGCLAQDAAAARAVNAYVKGLQQDLTSAGFYTGPVDGLYGPQTVAAVKALQKASGLPETGVVDPATEKALGDALTKKGVQQALNVAALQGVLTATGHYQGPIDGKWTTELEQALKDYQQSQQLPVTGTVDAATLAALLSLGHPSSSPSTTAASPSSTSSTVTTAPTTTAAVTTTSKA